MKKLLTSLLSFLLTSLFFLLPSPVHAGIVGNYFGDGSDGAVTISTNTNLTVPNKSGSYDGDMIVKNYSSLTVNEGVTLSVDQPNRGLLIYVSGNATINGTISMSSKGGNGNPSASGASDNSAVSATGIRLPMLKDGQGDILSAADFAGTGNAAVAAVSNQPAISGDGKIYTIPRSGASGGGGCSGAGCNGSTGSSGSSGQTGGGGGGGGHVSAVANGTGGNGGTGTCFGGGGGGGGSGNGTAGHGSNTAGGLSRPTTYNHPASSGSGTPPGTPGSPGVSGNTGVGGLIILVVGGDLTIGSGGSIVSKGTNSVLSTITGGASGGGSVLVLYAGTLSNSGTLSAAGGAGAQNNGWSGGGSGGAGTATIEQVDAQSDDSCTPSLTDSTHTITANCSFTNTIDGVDAGSGSSNTGSMSIQSGTLTVNSGYTVAAGTFNMTGGSIAINTGGKLKPGLPIWLVDEDADGYPTNTTHYVQTNAPTNGRRRNLMTSISETDCDDSSNSGTNTCAANYYGDGSDGAGLITSNTNFTSTTNGDMIVKNYTSLTINSGITLSVSNPNKGLLIYVTGDTTINGAITMTSKGGSVNPVTAGVSSTGIRLPMVKSGSTQTLAAADFAGTGSAAIAAVANQTGISSNGKIYTIPRSGASGGSGTTGNGNNGGSGSNGQSGGGGGGGGMSTWMGTGVGGTGGTGTCFGGGGGGGGSGNGTAGHGSNTAGGNGRPTSYGHVGGGGSGYAAGSPGGYAGVGGLIILVVGGDLTIGSGASITSHGLRSGSATLSGGASGGGPILILYAGSLSNSGSLTATGGSGAYGGWANGGNGGSGSITLEQITY